MSEHTQQATPPPLSDKTPAKDLFENYYVGDIISRLGHNRTDQKVDELVIEVTALRVERDALRQEIEFLRSYGNKDCTAMADSALREARSSNAKGDAP